MSRIKRWNTSQLKWIIVVRCWVRNELAATPQGPWSRPSVKQWTGASETSGKETTSTWRVTLFTTLISSIESSRPRWTTRRRFAFNRFKSFASCEWSAWMKLFKVTRPFVSCYDSRLLGKTDTMQVFRPCVELPNVQPSLPKQAHLGPKVFHLISAPVH